MIFAVSLSWIIGAYVTLGIGFILILMFFYDTKDIELYQKQGTVTLFHCVKCGHIYGSHSEHQMCSCAKCGFKNNKLTF